MVYGNRIMVFITVSLLITIPFSIGLFPGVSKAKSLQVKDIRYWTAPDHTRVVIDMSAESRYRVRELENPHRIAIDIPGSRFSPGISQVTVKDNVIIRIRVNRLSSGAQVVLDLPGKTAYRHFALKPYKNHPHRIVFDLDKSFSARELEMRDEKAKSVATSGNRIVIIDPGHGGSQPGACSRTGIKEKDVVLRISRLLADRIDSRPGFKAVMTRKGDYDVGLGRRIKIARSHGGECFVSVHLNAHPSGRARGSEVYFLSLGGATDENAQRVAERENFLLELGEEREMMVDDVQSILFDLTKSDIMYKSSQLAERVAARMSNIGSIPMRGVKQANFVVLRSIAMPSILVEAAFLSNPREARLVGEDHLIGRIADAIAGGVIEFMESTPPLIAQRGDTGKSHFSHIVAKGETLWSIARKYGLAVERIRSLNELDERSTIFPGQKLTVYREK